MCVDLYTCVCVYVYICIYAFPVREYVHACICGYVGVVVAWVRGYVSAWICECVVVGMYGCVGWGGGRSGVDCDGVCVYVYLCVCVCVCVCVCTCMCVWQAALASTVEAMKERGNVRQIMNTLKTSLTEVYTVCVCVRERESMYICKDEYTLYYIRIVFTHTKMYERRCHCSFLKLCVCMYVCVCACMCVCVCMYVCLCVCVYVCVFVYVCMCVCV